MEHTSEINREFEKPRRFDVATINTPRLKTVEELREQIELAQKDGGGIDTIITQEYSLEIGYTIQHLAELKKIAGELDVDLVLAPIGSKIGEQALTWGDIKSAMLDAGATI